MTETERSLRQWHELDSDPSNDLYVHFEEFGRWEWVEIACEARRVWNFMFYDEIEDWSPSDSLIGAAVAQGASGAFAAVAAAIGVDHKALEAVVQEHWYDCQDNPPPPVSADAFVQMCKEAAARRINADDVDN